MCDLSNLDDVDWQSLTHAYGAATDVPELIRALGSPDKALRDETLPSDLNAMKRFEKSFNKKGWF